MAVAEMSCAVTACTKIAPAGASWSARASKARRRSQSSRRAGAFARSRATPGRPTTTTVREAEQFAPAVPGGKSEKRIGADDERERTRRVFLSQILESEHRIARAGSHDFARVDFEFRMVGERKPDHGEAIRRRRHRRRAVRRYAGRDQAHRGERQCAGKLARELEVPAVNRVESAAEDAERFCGHGR